MDSDEAISHIISSAKYWSGDTMDNSYYVNNLGLERAFDEACRHVMRSHGYKLTIDDIKRAKRILKFDICNTKVCRGLQCRILRRFVI